MSAHRFGRRRTAVVTAGLAVTALVAGSLATPASAAPAPPVVRVAAVECPTAYPIADVEPGLVGEGLTVVTGTTPQPFRVEVLGLLTNALGPGRDLIMVRLSDLPGGAVISAGGGGWAGMSGSPVYVGDRLLGSFSYGATLAPSPIGALTPAADLLDLFSARGNARAGAATEAPTVRLSTAQRRQLSTTGAAVPSTLRPLITPLGVSGVDGRRLDRLQTQLDAAGLRFRAYAAGSGGSVGAAAGIESTPVAGGNFAAAVSYGDVALYGTGTTTAVCGDEAIAFGHPLLRTGAATAGASDATSVAIVRDDTLGSYKQAELGGLFGTLDQDRTGGVRADLTAAPSGTLVRTSVRTAERSRAGSSEVLDEAWLSTVGAEAAYGAQNTVFDETGDGTATTRWRITGTRAGGVPFSVARTNAWADRFDAASSGVNELSGALGQLVDNEAEDVTIESVDYRSVLATDFRRLQVVKLETSVDGGAWTTPKRLVVKAGATIRLRISLRHFRSTATGTRTVAVTVPASARGKAGSLLAAGGTTLADGAGVDCEFLGECGDAGASLNSVLAGIRSVPRNDALVSQLVLSDDEDEETVVAGRTSLERLTVVGSRAVPVIVR